MVSDIRSHEFDPAMRVQPARSHHRKSCAKNTGSKDVVESPAKFPPNERRFCRLCRLFRLSRLQRTVSLGGGSSASKFARSVEISHSSLWESPSSLRRANNWTLAGQTTRVVLSVSILLTRSIRSCCVCACRPMLSGMLSPQESFPFSYVGGRREGNWRIDSRCHKGRRRRGQRPPCSCHTFTRLKLIW